jgi:hypothetical protein
MRNKKYSQGVYKPLPRGGYIGKKNPRFLSSWEHRFFRWCDTNRNVIKWGSESLAIPYISPVDGKMHKYLVDNMVHLKEGTKVIKYLIEIKPKKQTKPPTTHGNKKRSTLIYENHTYAVNTAKWAAAETWCKSHDYKFLILTEDDLFHR